MQHNDLIFKGLHPHPDNCREHFKKKFALTIVRAKVRHKANMSISLPDLPSLPSAWGTRQQKALGKEKHSAKCKSEKCKKRNKKKIIGGGMHSQLLTHFSNFS
jgi:hypothetical protein